MEVKPFVKWAGGKTKLADYIIDTFPCKINNYYEPFLGGGGLLFKYLPKNAVVGDLNKELITAYQSIKSSPEVVIEYLKSIDNEFSNSEDYYKIRNYFNAFSEEGDINLLAAYFIWLNKHCFNGLYRVNKEGKFNVPFNGSLTKLSDKFYNNIFMISDYLNKNNIDIKCDDYRTICKSAKEGDFVYLDPPYINTFNDYTKEEFNHQELKDFIDELTKRKVKVCLSNSLSARELYKDYLINEINSNKTINRNGNDRKSKELLIYNY